MAYIFSDGFDHYRTLPGTKWDSVDDATNLSIAPTSGRLGGGALFLNAVTRRFYNLYKSFAVKGPTIYLTFALNPNTGNFSHFTTLFTLFDGTNAQVSLCVDTSRHFYFVRGGGAISATAQGDTFPALGSTSTLAPVDGVYRNYQVKIFLHSTAGTVDLLVDGVSWISATGLNTMATSNNTVNGLALRVFTESGSTHNWYIDDLVLNDSTGSGPLNTYPGDVSVLGQVPTGNGTATDYTQNVAARANTTAYAIGATILDSNSNLQRVTTAGTSGGSAPTWNVTVGGTTTDGTVTWTNIGTQAAYKLVNEPSADGDSSYLSDATAGHTSRFTFPAITGNSVKAVVLWPYAAKSDIGARAIRGEVKSSSTVADNGADLPLSTTYSYQAAVFETDPNTSAAWTVTGVNGAEFGAKTV